VRPRRCAWYDKSRVSFSDALASVREVLWKESFCLSGQPTDRPKIIRRLLHHFTDLLCAAA
jgi:hypothetical protein